MASRIRIIPMLAAAVLALTGCAANTTTTDTGDATTPQAGGTLVYGLPDDLGCIDPQQVSSNDAIVMSKPLVASLTWQNPDTGEIEPWLASSWEINDESTEFTFHLAEGASYSDGTPVDAASVKANFDSITEMGAVAVLGARYTAGLESVETPDDMTVQLTFASPRGDFLQASASQGLGMISTESTKKSQADRCAGDFAGSGPFTLDRYEPDTIAVLKGREDYAWAPPSVENQGAPYLDELRFAVIPESSTLTGTLLSNQIQASNNISALDQEIFAERGFELNNRANPGEVYGFLVNFDSTVGKDPAVRQALMHAIDRDAVNSLLTPNDRPATSVLSDTTPLYTDVSDEFAYDVDLANQLLDEAGWELGSDGVREKDGERLSFTLDYWQPTSDALQLIQQQFKDIGVDMQLKQTTVAQQTGTIGDGSRSLWWVNSTRADPSAMSSLIGPNALFNQNLPDTSIHEALQRIDEISDPEQRQEAVDEAVALILEQGAVIPVMQLSTTIVSSPTTHGITFDASSRVDFASAWTEQ
ncbi:ABC transporter substrate-binding protein [Gulosibacter sp. ACHW.36C]|uniref:ABC transporter substrate-binding protein n=1 Tax=Gulosibacter sediminis TaxID=1729695 RepID=A0ABY4MTY6_9MICO|nr:ABC transporter substrate-binding protein [Gulosibacter sediminis]UQN13876.1 ABC transporter substrate-binding protein [Gulosibacter sediminis]